MIGSLSVSEVSLACLPDKVTVSCYGLVQGNKKDVVDRVIGLIKMFGDRSRIREVAVVEKWSGDVPQSVGGDGALSPQCTVCRIFCNR